MKKAKLKVTGKYAVIIIASMIFGSAITSEEPETVTKTVTDSKAIEALESKVAGLEDEKEAALTAVAELEDKLGALEAEAEEPKKEEPKKEEPKKEEPKSATVSQENAVAKAESYLEFTAFSKKGLIEQLEFEGFSNADAAFAVDNISVDWNEQAVKKAKSYLDFSSFSRQGLIDQLEFEGFTTEQATHGANQVGLK
jgi:colicin import membrane protein